MCVCVSTCCARQVLADSLAGLGGAAGAPTTQNQSCLLLLLQGDGRDLIIVDTSGRHKQEAALFEEMRQVRAGLGFSGAWGSGRGAVAPWASAVSRCQDTSALSSIPTCRPSLPLDSCCLCLFAVPAGC